MSIMGSAIARPPTARTPSKLVCPSRQGLEQWSYPARGEGGLYGEFQRRAAYYPILKIPWSR